MKRSVALLLAAGLVLAMVPVIVGAVATNTKAHDSNTPALEAPALVPLSAPTSAPFTDVVPGSWYEEAVLWAYENNITSGVGDHLFGPNENITRGQVVTMLWRIEESPVMESETSFSDVADGKWYTDAVAWAAASEIVAGYPDGTFAPNQNITRQELVTILFRYARQKDPATEAPEDADLSGYSDVGQIGAFAVEPMRWAVGTGVVNGTSSTTLSPKDTATRAQFVQMLYRWLAKPADDDTPTEPLPTDPTEPELPIITEPTPTDPEPTQPTPTEPAPTEPTPTEPSPTDPAPTEPIPTEPTPTEPTPTEPAPTEPDPTEPSPTGDDWELPFLPNP
jgi:Uncharacterized protein conserved in bacteria